MHPETTASTEAEIVGTAMELLGDMKLAILFALGEASPCDVKTTTPRKIASKTEHMIRMNASGAKAGYGDGSAHCAIAPGALCDMGWPVQGE